MTVEKKKFLRFSMWRGTCRGVLKIGPKTVILNQYLLVNQLGLYLPSKDYQLNSLFMPKVQSVSLFFFFKYFPFASWLLHDKWVTRASGENNLALAIPKVLGFPSEHPMYQEGCESLLDPEHEQQCVTNFRITKNYFRITIVCFSCAAKQFK